MGEIDGVTTTLRISGVGYVEFLTALHTHLSPRSYLEVGTSSGASLAVADCDTIAVDPQFAIAAGATGNRKRTFFFQTTSDDFFATESAPALLGRPVDLALLDGMHWFEVLLRDFIGAEAACHARSLILLPACVPSNTRMALRQFEPGDSGEGDTAGWWTGDVWKLVPILREYRPDLRLHVLDCSPAGLVAVTGLDPASSVLSDRYHEIVDRYAATVLDDGRLRSLWDNLDLTASRPLCEQPDRLRDLFDSGARSKAPQQARPSQAIKHLSELLPPRELQDWVGGGGPAAFNATGDEFMGYLIDLCGLSPEDAVLDVGCGSGRMALPLTGYLNRDGHYAGFDVSREAIAWCTENISRSHPNFDFTVVDIQNSLYNPTGRCEASDFRFPYPDGSFDVVLLASLFTHMLPADVKHYLREVVRVLKPGGRSLITYFLLNETSSALSREGKTSFDFEHEMQGYRTTHLDRPEAATAYPEASVRDLYGECGLEIREPLRYGMWSGRTDGMSGQDVVIAVKSASTNGIDRLEGPTKYPLTSLPAENTASAEAASWSTQENDLEPGFGRSISFGRRGHSEEIIGPGWSLPEDNWRWMTGEFSVLTFPRPMDGSAADFILMLRVTPFLVNGQIDFQRCAVVCGSETVAEVKVRTTSWIGFRISAEAEGPEKLAIHFVHPDAESPQKYGIVPDPRELAIAVHEAVVLPAAENDEMMGWSGATGHFVSSDWRAQALVLDWKRIANSFQSMGQDCELGLVQRQCEAEPLGLFRFANIQLYGLTQCLRSDFSELTDEQEFNVYLYSTGEYHSQYEKLGLIQHTHVLAGQAVDVDALRSRELTRMKMLVRFFREDLEDGEKVFVLVRKFAPLDEFEVLPVVSLMRRYNPKASLLWVTVAGPDEGHLVGQCEMIGNNLLKGYIDRFSGDNDDWSTLSTACWRDLLVSALQALGKPVPTLA